MGSERHETPLVTRSEEGLRCVLREHVASLALYVASPAPSTRRQCSGLARITDPSLEQDRPGRVIDDIKQERPIDVEHLGLWDGRNH